jgi:thiamine-monophosphate kinase
MNTPEHSPENDLIRKIRGMAARPAGSKSGPKPGGLKSGGLTLGIDDDAALFVPRSGYQTILTCDWFLEGTHFLRDKHPADSVGWKSLARAVSDIAAMGGTPRCFLLSLALPAELIGSWLTEFLGGMRRASRKLHCEMAGGDTTRQPKALINITVVGEVKSGRALLRSGAAPGDIIYVSGRLGEADLGLTLLTKSRQLVAPASLPALRSSRVTARQSAQATNHATDPFLRKHLYPEPRVALGRYLADHRLATAMMDLSDGLSTDLPRLCQSSKVGAHIDASKLSVIEFPKRESASSRATKSIDPLSLALNGGDDYELLFTVPPTKARKLPRTFEGIPLTPIGEITRPRNLILIHPDGRKSKLHQSGWDPFSQK